jgi:hypothetical protein
MLVRVSGHCDMGYTNLHIKYFILKKMCNESRGVCMEISTCAVIHSSVMFCYQITAICLSRTHP